MKYLNSKWIKFKQNKVKICTFEFMKTTRPALSQLCLFLLLFESCGPVFYAPSTTTQPGFFEKGESQINFSTGITEDVTMPVHISGAYAFDSNYACYANYSNFREDRIGNNQYWGKASFGEAAIGYFYKAKSVNFGFETYFGTQLGRCDVHNYDQSINYNSLKPFGQINAHFRSRIFEMGMFVKTGYFFAFNIKPNDPFGMGFNRNFSDFLKEPQMPVSEFGFLLRLGYENVKIQLNYYFMFPTTSQNLWNISNQGISIGLFFSPKNIFRNTNKVM